MDTHATAVERGEKCARAWHVLWMMRTPELTHTRSDRRAGISGETSFPAQRKCGAAAVRRLCWCCTLMRLLMRVHAVVAAEAAAGAWNYACAWPDDAPPGVICVLSVFALQLWAHIACGCFGYGRMVVCRDLPLTFIAVANRGRVHILLDSSGSLHCWREILMTNSTNCYIVRDCNARFYLNRL